jgi:hypothetical protein
MKAPSIDRKSLASARSLLNISATERVQLVLGFEGDGLVVRFECRVCEEIMEWEEGRDWWVCSSCSMELTEQEAVKFFEKCYRQMGEVCGISVVTEVSEEKDERGRLGRWVGRVRSLTGI